MADNRAIVLPFSAMPPSTDQLVRELFVDREEQLKFAKRTLTGGTFDKIGAVHGKTRAGKSHLVDRLLLDVDQTYAVFKVNANNRGSVRAVLLQFWTQLHHAVSVVAETEVVDGATGIHEVGRAYLGEVDPLIGGEIDELTLTNTAAAILKLGGAIKLTPPGLSAEVTLSAETTESHTLAETTKRITPTDAQLVRELLYACDVLSHVVGKNVILFVDDMDLLDRPPATPPLVADALVDVLKQLADTPRITVLVTVRTAFFNGRDKDFWDFLKVDLLPTHHLRAIYTRHVQILNAGHDVFDSDTLDWIERSASGRVGMFLSLCWQLWRKYLPEPIEHINLAQAQEFVRAEWKEYRADHEHIAYVQTIEQAVVNNQTEVAFSADLNGTGLLLVVVTPIDGEPNMYRLNPLYAAAIKDLTQTAVTS